MVIIYCTVNPYPYRSNLSFLYKISFIGLPQALTLAVFHTNFKIDTKISKEQ